MSSASRAIRQAEVGASQTMIERTEACFGIKPAWLVVETPPMARPPTSIGWSTSRGSRRMCRSSTNRSAKMARSRAMTSSTTRCKNTLYMPGGQDADDDGRPCSAPITRSSISAPCRSVGACPLKAKSLPQNASARRVKRDVPQAAPRCRVGLTSPKRRRSAQSRRDRKEG